MKRFGIFLLAFVLLLSVTACAATDEGAEAPQPPSGEADASQAREPETEPNAATGDVVEMELFVNHTWWPLKEWQGSVPDYVTQVTGVRPVITVAADMQQLPLMIASNDLPELIYTDNTQNMQNRLADASFCWAWDDLLTQYTPGFQWDEDRAKLYRKEDGSFYTILNNYSTKAEMDANPYALEKMGAPIVRQSLMDQLGNPEINTIDDYVDVLIMARDTFPDLVPVIFNTNWTGAGQTSNYFFSQLGIDYNGFVIDEETEEISYYIYQEGRLDYYKLMNRLYREGLMLPENYAFSNEEESTQYATGLKCFSYIKNVDDDREINNKSAALGIEGDWVKVNPNLGGERYKRYDRNTGWSGLYVAKTNKNPQKAADFISYLLTEEGMRTTMWGLEGTHWNMTEEGYPVFIPEIQDTDYRNKEGIRQWGILAGTYVIELLCGYDPEQEDIAQRIELSQFIKEHTVYVNALGLVSPGADSDEQNILTKLNDMVKNEEVKIYMADSEAACEQAYLDMLATAESLRVAELEEWANQEYQAVKKIMGD